MNTNYRGIFDSDIDITFKTAVKLLAEYPKSAAALLKVATHESKAKKIRDQWLKEDVIVPPLLIVSATDKCNLCCKECYAINSCREKKNELTKEQITDLLNQASVAGCTAILVAGGEPFLSPSWIHSVAEHKEMAGLVFTNGTLFDERWQRFFAENRNMIPLFSIEGSPERTDDRRGAGVTEKIISAMKELRKQRIPFGISVTTGSHNIDEVTADDFAAPYIELGCKLVIHVEYVPVGTNKDFIPLTPDNKTRLFKYCGSKSGNEGAIYIVFPGNEDIYGGCLAAGRGFAHISASGSLEPCPFAPYSDRNLSNMTFIEALKSPLLKAVRAESSLLREGIGGCSLRGKETALRELIAKEHV